MARATWMCQNITQETKFYRDFRFGPILSTIRYPMTTLLNTLIHNLLSCIQEFLTHDARLSSATLLAPVES